VTIYVIGSEIVEVTGNIRGGAGKSTVSGQKLGKSYGIELPWVGAFTENGGI